MYQLGLRLGMCNKRPSDLNKWSLIHFHMTAETSATRGYHQYPRLLLSFIKPYLNRLYLCPLLEPRGPKVAAVLPGVLSVFWERQRDKGTKRTLPVEFVLFNPRQQKTHPANLPLYFIGSCSQP